MAESSDNLQRDQVAVKIAVDHKELVDIVRAVSVNLLAVGAQLDTPRPSVATGRRLDLDSISAPVAP
ncbi:MAG: hypothetical protein ACJ72D_20455, partial [Marmoricola sp.]